MPFSPTHVVPQGGIEAWPAPDPSGATPTHVPAGTEVQLGERRGDWGHVTAANAWVGWVDASRLVPRGATTRGTAPPPPSAPDGAT